MHRVYLCLTGALESGLKQLSLLLSMPPKRYYSPHWKGIWTNLDPMSLPLGQKEEEDTPAILRFEMPYTFSLESTTPSSSLGLIGQEAMECEHVAKLLLSHSSSALSSSAEYTGSSSSSERGPGWEMTLAFESVANTGFDEGISP